MGVGAAAEGIRMKEMETKETETRKGIREDRIRKMEIKETGRKEAGTKESGIQEIRKKEGGKENGKEGKIEEFGTKENESGGTGTKGEGTKGIEIKGTGTAKAVGKEAGTEESVYLEFESRSHNEQFARVVAAVFAARLDPTVEEIEDIKTAVSEAVTNAIIHGYEIEEGIVHMKLTMKGQTLSVEVRDEGVGIADIKKAMEPLYTSKPSRERSGMGFSFMEAFMDEVWVDSAPGRGTTVRMVKKLENSPAR